MSKKPFRPAPSFPGPFSLPLPASSCPFSVIQISPLISPHYTASHLKFHHHTLKEVWHPDRTDSSYHSVFCISTEPKDKGRNEHKPSRQTHLISFKHCPLAGFSMQFLMDWMVSELCIFLTIPPSFKGLFCSWEKHLLWWKAVNAWWRSMSLCPWWASYLHDLSPKH